MTHVWRSASCARCIARRCLHRRRRSAQGVRDHTRPQPRRSTHRHRVAGQRAHADRRRRSASPPHPDLGPHGRRHRRGAARRCARSLPAPTRALDQGRAARPRVSARVAVVDVPGARSRVSCRGATASRSRRRCPGRRYGDATRYVLEIVTERGRVPVGAERGDHRDATASTSSTCRRSRAATCRRRSRPACRASCTPGARRA